MLPRRVSILLYTEYRAQSKTGRVRLYAFIRRGAETDSVGKGTEGKQLPVNIGAGWPGIRLSDFSEGLCLDSHVPGLGKYSQRMKALQARLGHCVSSPARFRNTTNKDPGELAEGSKQGMLTPRL